jgi:hypothetical protein
MIEGLCQRAPLVSTCVLDGDELIAAQELARDLTEDLATSWIPDVMANADLVEQLREPSLNRDDVDTVDVPKPGGGARTVPVLNGSALSALRLAVQGAREQSEFRLNPTVCGYRRGATGDVAYSEEYLRFRAIADGLSEQHRFVVQADIRNFFESVDIDILGSLMTAQLGDAWWSIANFLAKTRKLGIRGLPAGYGDARLIANLILTAADESIGAAFTRWVDDYRIFVDSKPEADELLHKLSSVLAGFGMELNLDKLQVLDADDYRARVHGPTLDSVYHPQEEPPDVVRTNLRTVFLRAISDGDRRMLRFSLPRLAQQRDDVAVTYVLWALERNAVDAPRMVHYLSFFLHDQAVVNGLEKIVMSNSLWPWTLIRLTPLLARAPLSSITVAALAGLLHTADSPSLWGALLRVLSARGRISTVRDLLRDPAAVPDARASIAACLDLGLAIPPELGERAPKTFRAIEHLGQIPLPSAESQL